MREEGGPVKPSRNHEIVHWEISAQCALLKRVRNADISNASSRDARGRSRAGAIENAPHRIYHLRICLRLGARRPPALPRCAMGHTYATGHLCYMALRCHMCYGPTRIKVPYNVCATVDLCGSCSGAGRAPDEAGLAPAQHDVDAEVVDHGEDEQRAPARALPTIIGCHPYHIAVPGRKL